MIIKRLVSYQSFYDHLWNNSKLQEILYPVRSGLRKYVEGVRNVKLIDGVATDLKCFEVLIKNYEEVLKICESYVEEYEEGMIVEELLSFQKHIIIKWDEKENLNLHYNLDEFFRKALTVPPGETLENFEFKIIKQYYSYNDKYYRNAHLEESVPKPKNKMEWRKVFKKSNMRFRNTYKASIIFDASSEN